MGNFKVVGFGITTSAIVLLLFLPSPVRGEDSDKIKVSISGNSVKLACPIEKATWWRKEKVMKKDQKMLEIFQGLQHSGLYKCGDSTPSNSIYLHTKECLGCMEMNLWLVVGIIGANLLFTLGILSLTCYCSQRRALRFGGGPATEGPRARLRGQREDRPPPVPNPDYEPIQKGQREVYAGLEPRAF